MSDLIEVVFRTVFLYVLILVIFRLMGKREVGELSVMDLVVFVLIAEVAAFALDDLDEQFFQLILPMICLLVLQVTMSYISLKSKAFRDLIDGDPALIIKDGVILEQEMRRHRYNLDDLLQQLREKSIPSVQNVAFAFLEPSGNLSVYMKDEPPFEYPLVIDGDIQKRHLMLMHKDEEWLLTELAAIGFNDVTDIFFCSIGEENQLYVQRKESSSRK